MGRTAHHYLIFETAGGFCGIAWNSVGKPECDPCMVREIRGFGMVQGGVREAGGDAEREEGIPVRHRAHRRVRDHRSRRRETVDRLLKAAGGSGGSGLLLMLYGLQGQRLPPAAVRLAAKVGGSRIRPTRFRITRPRFQDRLMSPLPDSPPTEIRANESRHREDAGRLPRNRWFEACSLQRRVCCEPLHGATSVRTQSSSHRRSFRRVAAGSDPA
jgi:hypothetical protein